MGTRCLSLLGTHGWVVPDGDGWRRGVPTEFSACSAFVHLGRGGVGLGLFRGCAGGVGWSVILLLLLILPGDSLALVLVVFLLVLT